MDEILFLSQRIPYPPNKGDKIRSWHLLRHLAERHRVHLGCFVDDPDDWRHLPELRRMTADCRAVGLRPPLAKLRSLGRLATGEALTLGYFHDRRLAAWVAGVLAERPIAGVVAFSSAMAGYVMRGTPPGAPLVADLVDVDSAKWGQYGARAGWPMSAIYRRECAILGRFEAAVARRFDATLLVSEPEAELLRRAVPDAAGRIVAVENGVDHVFFSPGHDLANPYPGDVRPIVFTGAMDYWPNADAVAWFAREVLPAIVARVPAARFYIVGTNPTPEVLALARPGRVAVTGRVADIRGYIAHAAVAVAPLRIAQGVQNKVLEAMAMARPVVATPQALLGIDARPGTHLLVAEGADGFAAAVADAIDSPAAAEMALRARRRIVERYDWTARLARLDALLAGPARRAA